MQLPAGAEGSVGGQFVVAAANILDKAWPILITRTDRICFETTHRP
jgi:hypothetical protein